MDDQERRNVVLKELLEFRLLIQEEALADDITERKELSQACSMQLANLLHIFDNLIERTAHQFSPGVQRAINQWEARQNEKDL
jgi:hypothetical protein